jgi:hypothetical protein
MKANYKNLAIAVALVLVVMVGCKKEDDPVSTVVNVSYPTIELAGDPVVSLSVGDSYTEAGATGTDDISGATSQLTPISNNVDPSTPGFYSVLYSTKNSNGYVTTAIRLVLVSSANPALDISGTYARTSNGVEVHVTKVGTGLFIIDNIGGVADATPEDYLFDVYMGMPTDSTLEIPVQPNGPGLGGEVYADNASISLAPGDTTFSYVVHGAGFGTALRTFVKQ